VTGDGGSVVDGGNGFLTADVIAKRVGGHLVGDPHARVSGVAPLDRAGASELSFLASAKYAGAFGASRAGIVLLSPALANTPGPTTARIVVDEPQAALLAVLPLLHPPRERRMGISATAIIGRGVQLGDEVWVGPYAVLGDGARVGRGTAIAAHAVVGDEVEIGDGGDLREGVVLYTGTVLGARVIVHAGARLGCDGFGYVQRGGRHEKIPHVGRCVIGDDVEIGANSTIDRGSIDDTVVGTGTKIDNLVHIAHNVRIGQRCLIMAQAGIAGSVRIEDDCIIAGQVGIAQHVTVGRGARLAAQAGAFGDIPAGETWSGYPARPHRESLRASAALFKLAGMIARLEQLVAAKDGK
jgi:UDP-3-O-[3-hydroxymyristoyl] glucosamine N-acyltransferase